MHVNEVKLTKNNWENLYIEALTLGKAYVEALEEQKVRQGFTAEVNG